MKKTSALLGGLMALAIAANAQTTNLIWKDDGSGNPTVSYNFVEDAGLVGIGTTAPSAKLQINKPPTTFTADLFAVNSTSLGPPPTFTLTENPLFKITAGGLVGVGTATPLVLMHLKQEGFSATDPMDNPVMLIDDENDNTIMGFLNTGENTNPSGMLFVRSRDNIGPDGEDVVPALGVLNADNQLLNFVVGGDGTVALGLDVSGTSTWENEAQLNIHQALNSLSEPSHSFLFNVANASGSTQFFSIRKTGEVGIGVAGVSNTALSVFKDGNNTYLDLLAGSSYTKAIRFMGSSNSQPRHVITETGGDFVIDPGVSGGGGNDLLKVDGNLQIGTEKPTTSTFINSTSGEHNLSVNGWVVAKKVMVQTTDWADKVFMPGYPLNSLKNVEAYIKQHQHLPEIPSECEVLTNGVDIGEMNKLLLQKVEELTLYVIALQKQIDELKK